MKLLVLLLAPSLAMAADFFHPETASVVIAGPPDTITTVCAFQRSDSTTTAAANWVCNEYALGGARAPLWVPLDVLGPVRVSGCDWAYSEAAGVFTPMQAR